MQRIALTGGIASGKSYVADYLHRVHGFTLVDSDVLARQAVEPGTPGLKSIVEAFGDAVLAKDGSLDRQALAAIIFEDAKKRLLLDSIIHPAILALRNQIMDEHKNSELPVIAVIPLLVEKRLMGDYDIIITVESTPDLQLERLVHNRGMDREQAQARIHSQCSNEERAAVATIIIRNVGTLAQVEAQIDEVAKQLITDWKSV